MAIETPDRRAFVGVCRCGPKAAGADAVVCDLETASAEDVAVLLSGAAAVPVVLTYPSLNS